MQPWERLSGESEEAHSAFMAYLSQPKGERSIREVAQELHKSATLLGRWSSKWQWQKRVSQWDEEQTRLTAEAMADAQRETARQDHEQLTILKNKLFTALNNREFTEEGIVVLLSGLSDLVKLDRIVLGLDNGGRGGVGNGSKQATAPQFIKLYEGVDVSQI